MNLAEKPKEEDNSQVVEAILHTVIRYYPDGRVFPVKQWITQKGVVKTKSKKEKPTVSLDDAKHEEDLLL